jgi:uncharacterized protein (TIGR02145 family)
MIGTSGIIAIKDRIIPGPVDPGATPDASYDYGYLYNYYAVTGIGGSLISSPWRVPTMADWQTLIAYCGGNDEAASKLRIQGTYSWFDTLHQGLNSFGFSALATGNRTYFYAESDPGIGYSERNVSGDWWSTSPDEMNESYIYSVKIGSQFLNESYDYYTMGKSIRCVSDEEPFNNTDQDGHQYGWVQIGDQYWMTSDLRTTHYMGGNPITHITNYKSWTEAYYQEAYCIYGEPDVDIPKISTSPITYINKTSFTTGSSLISSGGSSVTSRGICYSSTNTLPTIADTKTTDSTSSSSVVNNLTGLSEDTIYYVVAYAINSFGVAYGQVFSIRTLKTIIQFPFYDYWSFNGISDFSKNIIGNEGHSLTPYNVVDGQSKSGYWDAVNFPSVWFFTQPRLTFGYNMGATSLFTISAWLRPAANSNHDIERCFLSMPGQLEIVYGDSAGTYANPYIVVRDLKTLKNVKAPISIKIINDGQSPYTHVAITVNRILNDIRIYINDVDLTESNGNEGTASGAGFNNNLYSADTCFFNIGSYDYDVGRDYIGDIDELRIYNTIPIRSELTAAYNATVL